MLSVSLYLMRFFLARRGSLVALCVDVLFAIIVIRSRASAVGDGLLSFEGICVVTFICLRICARVCCTVMLEVISNTSET
jgi:hypothetical protein